MTVRETDGTSKKRKEKDDASQRWSVGDRGDSKQKQRGKHKIKDEKWKEQNSWGQSKLKESGNKVGRRQRRADINTERKNKLEDEEDKYLQSLRPRSQDVLFHQN